MNKRILVITSKYKHHSDNAGYIQLAKFTNPTYVIGIDETSHVKIPKVLLSYKWLYEFIGWWKYRNKIDLVHIYYGEEYYRFSAFLFRHIPVIVTFHQPKERLTKEIRFGGDGGRIYRLVHQFTKSRFKRLAAAIVLEENQKEVLKDILPETKIHVIYHGVYLQTEFQQSKPGVKRDANLIVSIGNWLRDWNFFENILKEAATQFPDVIFKLINKNIDSILLERLNNYKNFKYEEDVNEEEFINYICAAKFIFLPLKSGAGNNALMESLALGTPTLLPDIFNSQFQLKCEATIFYKLNDVVDCMLKIRHLLNTQSQEDELLKSKAQYLIKKFSWEEIANQTYEVYKNCLNDDLVLP